MQSLHNGPWLSQASVCAQPGCAAAGTLYGAPEGASQVLQRGLLNVELTQVLLSRPAHVSVQSSHTRSSTTRQTQSPHISTPCVPQPPPSPCCTPLQCNLVNSVTSLQHSPASVLLAKNKCTSMCALQCPQNQMWQSRSGPWLQPTEQLSGCRPNSGVAPALAHNRSPARAGADCACPGRRVAIVADSVTGCSRG